MDTAFLLAAKYNMKPAIPVDLVRADFFPHLKLETFIRKLESGEIRLPLVYLHDSQKSVKSIPLNDLVAYIDEKFAKAREMLSRK